jgi:hypothetical protein
LFAGLGDVLNRIAPEATAVAIAHFVFKLITHAIDDRDRWRRFLFLVFLALAVVTVWWVFVRGGVQVLLHDFDPASITRPRQPFG